MIWIRLLITVSADIFRRRDTSGWMKALRIVFVIVVPYLGVLAYLIVEHQGMADRRPEAARAQRAPTDDYVRSVAGSDGPAAEIEREGAARRDHAGRARRGRAEGARRDVAGPRVAGDT